MKLVIRPQLYSHSFTPTFSMAPVPCLFCLATLCVAALAFDSRIATADKDEIIPIDELTADVTLTGSSGHHRSAASRLFKRQSANQVFYQDQDDEGDDPADEGSGNDEDDEDYYSYDEEGDMPRNASLPSDKTGGAASRSSTASTSSSPSPSAAPSATIANSNRIKKVSPPPVQTEGSGGQLWSTTAVPSFNLFPDLIEPEPDPTVAFPSYFDVHKDPSKTFTEKPVNQAPYVVTKLKKYPVTAGKSFSLRIPEETFNDPEDGNTANLRLQLKNDDGSLVTDNWIRFDEVNQTLHVLPVDENAIGRYPFRLEARDKEGLSTYDTLEIVVRQYSGSRLVSHQFNMEFSFADWNAASAGLWQWKLLDAISHLYGDAGSNHIIVRQVSENPYIFGWTNDTLTQASCPKELIRSLFAKLVDGKAVAAKANTGSPSRALKIKLGSSFVIKSVSVTWHGTCLHEASSFPSSIAKEDSVPVIRNPIDRINVTAGELLRFKVPEDTCWDEEDGGTAKLNLHLLTTNRRELSPNAWLQFDAKNQEFIGIPLEEEVGREEYQLVCSDRNGLSAIDGIVVIVQNRPFSERFGIEFALEFQDFAGVRRESRVSTKVRIVELISAFFGDPTPSNVVLKSFDFSQAKVVWYNKSLAYVSCEDPLTRWVTSQMLLPDGKVKPKFVQHFEPYLQLGDVNAVKRGACTLDLGPNLADGQSRGGHDGTATHGDSPQNKDSFFHGVIPSAEYLLTFIIPAVIISCMLILAILLACILHKKRKAGKLNLFYSESLPPRVPVILQDELYDDQDQGFYKQPILLPEDGRQYVPQSQHEMDQLLQLQQPMVNVNLDAFARGGSLSRPTPAYQRRQV